MFLYNFSFCFDLFFSTISIRFLKQESFASSSVNSNQALFALLGTTYGGNGTTTFNIPDLRKKKSDGSYYVAGEIMEDGTPYIESYICYEGIFPLRA